MLKQILYYFTDTFQVLLSYLVRSRAGKQFCKLALETSCFNVVIVLSLHGVLVDAALPHCHSMRDGLLLLFLQTHLVF